MRIPNNALTFRPSAAAFAAVGQEPPVLNSPGPSSDGPLPKGSRERYVWTFENRQFVAIRVGTGLADDHWTELVSGPVHAGDALVTSANPARD